jgi:hypothetical protein
MGKIFRIRDMSERRLIVGLEELARYLELGPALLCALLDEHELFPLPNPELFPFGKCTALFRSDEVDCWKPVADLYAGRRPRSSRAKSRGR